MTHAVARAEKRDILLANTRAGVDEITQLLDSTTREYDDLNEVHQVALKLVASKNAELREAAGLVRKAKSERQANSLSIGTTKKQIKAAKLGIRAAKAREKMPLRILITPRKGQERIKQVQRLLAEIGYQPGVADGAVGKNTRKAIKAFQRELNVAETGEISDQLVDELFSRTGKTQKANAQLYVRQGFKTLFNAPVSIRDPSKPLGTHVYTAMYFDKASKATNWTSLTVKRAVSKGRKSRRGKGQASASIRQTPKQVLDRLNIPGPVRRQVSMLLTPGSSLIVSDKGISYETGKGTDFVVLTK